MSDRPVDRDLARLRDSILAGDTDRVIAAMGRVADALEAAEQRAKEAEEAFAAADKIADVEAGGRLAAEARVVQLEAQLADFDEKWYPQLAGTALGEKSLGHTESAERWGALCRDWRDLVAAVSVADSGPEECQHPSASFDRTICACGSMHHYCDACGKTLDCPLDSGPEEKKP